MSLFGPPNVDKLRKKGRIWKLIGLLTHKDTLLASSALSALQQIAEDKELEQIRKRFWGLNAYTNVLKKIEKLDYDNKSSIIQLTNMLIKEKEEMQKKVETFQHERDELKKRFEDSFKSLSGTNDVFFNSMKQALGKNKDFLYVKKLAGRYPLSFFSGVIVTIDKIIYFELNLTAKIVCFHYNEIKEFKLGKYKIEIISNDGSYMKIHIDDGDKEMITFIEEKISKSNK